MKNIIITIILSVSLLTATVTNDGATITIGDGVVMRVDGDFTQEGTLNIDGTFSISGTFSGEFNGSEGYTWGYFGGATIESSSFDNLLIEGDATLAGDVNANSLNLSDGALNLNGHDISLSESGVFSQSNGSLVGSGYIHGYDGQYGHHKYSTTLSSRSKVDHDTCCVSLGMCLCHKLRRYVRRKS